MNSTVRLDSSTSLILGATAAASRRDSSSGAVG